METSTPSNVTVPEVAGSNVPRMLNRELFPEPLGPEIDKLSPDCNSKEQF
jgi:hypothetical protein